MAADCSAGQAPDKGEASHHVDPQDRPKLKTPPGATDTHVHFYGSEAEYPPAPSAAFLPPPARVADYRGLQARLGLERVVVVQPSSYGTDNRCTMDAVAELGPDRARAVVVVDQTVGDTELERLTRAGGAASASTCSEAASCLGTSWRRWRPACTRSAGTCSCSATAASCPSARRC